MSFKERSAPQDLIIFGTEEGASVSGLLLRVDVDPQYENNIYILVQRDGSEKKVAGCTSLNNQYSASDIGSLVRMTFLGWGSGARGKFKRVKYEVFDLEGEAEEKVAVVHAWPRYDEAQRERAHATAGAAKSVELKAPKAAAPTKASTKTTIADDEIPF
jgi:hypothetical protein